MPDTGAPHASGAPLAAGAPSAENMRELAAAIRSDTNASAPGRDAILGHLRSALALLTGDHDAKEPTDHAATTATKGPLAGRRWASSARVARADQRAKDNAEKLLDQQIARGCSFHQFIGQSSGPVVFLPMTQDGNRHLRSRKVREDLFRRLTPCHRWHRRR